MSTAQILSPGGKVQTVRLTREHSASSYGLPVVVRQGVALGPAELEGVLIVEDPVEAGRAEAAGYLVALDFDEADEFLRRI